MSAPEIEALILAFARAAGGLVVDAYALHRELTERGVAFKDRDGFVRERVLHALEDRGAIRWTSLSTFRLGVM